MNTWDGKEGFDFLGFHHRKFPKHVKDGKRVHIMAHVPSKKAMKNMQKKEKYIDYLQYTKL